MPAKQKAKALDEGLISESSARKKQGQCEKLATGSKRAADRAALAVSAH